MRAHPVNIILFLLMLMGAFWLGAKTSNGFRVPGSSNFSIRPSKVTEVMGLVNASYVDEPKISELMDGSIDGMLRKLDPHSVYIPRQDQTRIAERFAGEFSGIGIQFDIRDDLLTVVSPIPGTPADRMGLRAGDIITKIDSISTFGITYDEVFTKLRGKEGTKVDLSIQRRSTDSNFELTLTRGAIPIHSIESAFLLKDGLTGYILINQFTAVTEEEFDDAFRKLQSRG